MSFYNKLILFYLVCVICKYSAQLSPSLSSCSEGSPAILPSKDEAYRIFLKYFNSELIFGIYVYIIIVTDGSVMDTAFRAGL
jgi:hypothetical protein